MRWRALAKNAVAHVVSGSVAEELGSESPSPMRPSLWDQLCEEEAQSALHVRHNALGGGVPTDGVVKHSISSGFPLGCEVRPPFCDGRSFALRCVPICLFQFLGISRPSDWLCRCSKTVLGLR